MSLKQAGKKVIPPQLWHRLRKGKRDTQEIICRAMLGSANRIAGHAESLCMLHDTEELTPESLVRGYMQGMGVFVGQGEVRWLDPDPRGIVPINEYHVEKETRRIIRQNRFTITVDQDFHGVITCCAEPVPGRETTFIVPRLVEVYLKLHELGVAHSVEAWKDDQLVGGVFGLALGAYFIGESQFHRVRNAGKVAFVYLMEILKDREFQLHDAFWASDHIARFGGFEMPRTEFKEHLIRAVISPATFGPLQGKAFHERF